MSIPDNVVVERSSHEWLQGGQGQVPEIHFQTIALGSTQENLGFHSRSPLGTRSGCRYPWEHCSLRDLDPGEMPRNQDLVDFLDAIDYSPWSKEE